MGTQSPHTIVQRRLSKKAGIPSKLISLHSVKKPDAMFQNIQNKCARFENGPLKFMGYYGSISVLRRTSQTVV